MKDLGHANGIEDVLAVWQTGEIGELAATLHRDFMAFGREEGLYVQADRQTFLSHAKRTAFHRASGPEVGWCNIHGPLAALCLINRTEGASRATVLSLLKSGQGWQVMTATFTVCDAASHATGRELEVQ